MKLITYVKGMVVKNNRKNKKNGKAKSLMGKKASNLNRIIADYLFEKQKKHILTEKIDPRDHEIIENVMPAITFVSQFDIDCHKENDEYNKIYSLLKESKIKMSLDDELVRIYEKNRMHALNYLYIRRGRVIRRILGEQLQNYKCIKKIDPNKSNVILERCLSKATSNDKEHLKFLDDAILKHRYHVFMLKLRASLFKTESSPGDYLESAAVLIASPKYQLPELMRLDEAWGAFPLKWHIHNKSISYGRAVFYAYKDGEDLSNIFSQEYGDGRFEKINELVNSAYLYPPASHMLCSRAPIINEVLLCYRKNIYSASICTALTVIEGMIWDFSKEYHALSGGVYCGNDFTKIKLDSQKETSNFTVGTLLKQTNFKEVLNMEFITYFCDELYNERNPILHGQELECFNLENASKKIATIEYLLTVVAGFHKLRMMKTFDESLDEDTKKRLLKALDK